jgi:hypothetical protein
MDHGGKLLSGSTQPEDNKITPRRKKVVRTITGIIVITLIILATYIIILYDKDEKEYFTLKEINEMWSPYSYELQIKFPYKAGDVIYLKDKVIRKSLLNSTYGPVTILGFNTSGSSGPIALMLIGDMFDDYRVNSRAVIELHINTWNCNDHEYLWIDELMPFYIFSASFLYASFIGGIPALPDLGYDGNGIRLNIFNIFKSFDFSLMNLTLIQESPYDSYDFYGAQKLYMDEMDPMFPGKSKNGLITIDDYDNDGNISNFDSIIMDLEPTYHKHKLEMYYINIKGMLEGQFFIANWYDG